MENAKRKVENGKRLEKIIHFPFSVFYFSFLHLCCLFIFSITVFTQNLPKEIRGYKVYQARISVKNKTEKAGARDKSEAFVKVGEPELVDVSLTGITFEISAEIDSIAQNGTIDFLTFDDFRVNGLQVDIEEYREPFELKKNRSSTLPQPIKIFVGAGQTLRGALKEVKESKDEWTVTGKLFVFGQFKKSFLKFKRVVPVEINLTIKNPLK
ncbi:MAG: hypothetical protein LH614_10040 [Pyrinomonadaceae bacterium]|nr:hypothetical protein [Pyrinomonadaceae bacterium]